MHPTAMHTMERCDFYPNVTSEIQIEEKKNRQQYALVSLFCLCLFDSEKYERAL